MKAKFYMVTRKENPAVPACAQKTPVPPAAHARKNQVGVEVEVRGDTLTGFVDDVTTLSHLH